MQLWWPEVCKLNGLPCRFYSLDWVHSVTRSLWDCLWRIVWDHMVRWSGYTRHHTQYITEYTSHSVTRNISRNAKPVPETVEGLISHPNWILALFGIQTEPNGAKTDPNRWNNQIHAGHVLASVCCVPTKGVNRLPLSLLGDFLIFFTVHWAEGRHIKMGRSLDSSLLYFLLYFLLCFSLYVERSSAMKSSL